MISLQTKIPTPSAQQHQFLHTLLPPLCPGELSSSDQRGGQGRDWCNKQHPALLLGNSVRERPLVARGEGDLLIDGTANWRGDGSPVPTNDWIGIPADSLILSLSFDLLMLINELRMNSLGTGPTLTLAVQGILKPRIRRTRGSGCNPNSENISLLRALNPDSDMGTTQETISKKLWLDSNYMNFNRWVRENHVPLRFLQKYFIHPFQFSISEYTYLAKKILNICSS